MAEKKNVKKASEEKQAVKSLAEMEGAGEFYESPEDIDDSGLISEEGAPEVPWEPYDVDGEPSPENEDEEKVKKKGKKDNAEELVELFIPATPDDTREHITISINLKEYKIPVGEPAMVPKFVRDYWLTMNRQNAQFAKTKRALAN